MLTLAKRARQARKVGEVLNEVALREGETVLSELLREKLGATPPEARPLAHVAARTARDWESLFISTLGQRGNLLKRSFAFGARATTFWGSSLLGLVLPDREARFFKKGDSGSYVALRSAPFVSIEIMIEWMQRLFALAANHPDLSPDERKDLDWLAGLLKDVEEGLASGVRWKRGKQGKPIGVALAPLAYHRLEHWFSSWNDKTKTG